jgi:hypothetical protein
MEFRKCTSFLLAVLLLISNAGLAFNVHFCEGEIASVSTIYNIEEVCEMPVATPDKVCCTEAAKDHKSCCKDKTVDLQDKSDNKIVKTFSIAAMAFFVVPETTSFRFAGLPATVEYFASTYKFEEHSPPLFQLYSQYIFYA